MGILRDKIYLVQSHINEVAERFSDACAGIRFPLICGNE